MRTEVITLGKNLDIGIKKESFIQEEMESQDPFVRVLYRDLENRLQSYESEGSGIERLKFSDLKAEIVMAVAITVFLVSVIL